jgi:hypothetical protein
MTIYDVESVRKTNRKWCYELAEERSRGIERENMKTELFKALRAQFWFLQVNFMQERGVLIFYNVCNSRHSSTGQLKQ